MMNKLVPFKKAKMVQTYFHFDLVTKYAPLQITFHTTHFNEICFDDLHSPYTSMIKYKDRL